MIKIQKEDFGVDSEIKKIKSLHPSIGAVSIFIGYVRNINEKKEVKIGTTAKKQVEKTTEKAAPAAETPTTVHCIASAPILAIIHSIILSLFSLVLLLIQERQFHPLTKLSSSQVLQYDYLIIINVIPYVQQ